MILDYKDQLDFNPLQVRINNWTVTINNISVILLLGPFNKFVCFVSLIYSVFLHFVLIPSLVRDIPVSDKCVQDGDPLCDHQITVCVRKRPMSQKEMKKKEVDVVTCPNKDQVFN